MEADIADNLKTQGTPFEYETLKIPYVQPQKPRTYTPDFILPNGIIIEAKGRFMTADRQKTKMVIAQYPDLDLRFVFNNPQAKINKGSKTSYADWCERYGCRYAARLIPTEWMEEASNPAALAAIQSIKDKSK